MTPACLEQSILRRGVSGFTQHQHRQRSALGPSPHELGQRHEITYAVPEAHRDRVGFVGEHRVDDAVELEHRLHHETHLRHRVHQVGARRLVGISDVDLPAIGLDALLEQVSALERDECVDDDGIEETPPCACRVSSASCFGRMRPIGLNGLRV